MYCNNSQSKSCNVISIIITHRLQSDSANTLNITKKSFINFLSRSSGRIPRLLQKWHQLRAPGPMILGTLLHRARLLDLRRGSGQIHAPVEITRGLGLGGEEDIPRYQLHVFIAE